MAKKILRSGFTIPGITPNLLLSQVENAAPYLFNGEIATNLPAQEFLRYLTFYKKNSAAIHDLNLASYFKLCLCAHWATAGSFIPTDVDNQIRFKLWQHPELPDHVDQMVQTVIEARSWDYRQVTNRQAYDLKNQQTRSTHEGTWFSVAIGAYCALQTYGHTILAEKMASEILAEIHNEENFLIQVYEKNQDHLNYLRAAPLMAHNFGDLDRVMVQWDMHETDSFCQKIYRLGHNANANYSPLLVQTGKVNKEFSSKENHRHMTLRQPKCLRKSHLFLIPVGPFFDDWGTEIGQSDLLSLEEKAEIIAALFEGFKREEQAHGYARGYGAIMRSLGDQVSELERYQPIDLVHDLSKSSLKKIADLFTEEFHQLYLKRLQMFLKKISSL